MKRLLLPVILLIASFSFAQKKEMSVKESVLLQRSVSPDRVTNFLWMNDSEYTTCSKDYKTMYKSSVGNDKSIDLITIDEINKELGSSFGNFFGAEWENDHSLLLNDGQTIARFDIQTKTGKILKNSVSNSGNHSYHAASNQLAYTIDNNLYVDGRAITKNSDKNIVSGQSIARNEFGISGGIFWSIKGSFLAFYQKDETNVHDYPLLDVNTTPASLVSIKYPMAGQKSEKPRVGIYNVKSKKVIYISPSGASDDYFTNLTFTPDEQFIIVAEVNRDQNHMWLNVYSTKTGKFVKTLFEEKNDKWIEPEHPAFFPNATSNSFVWISERDGFNNLYLYDFNGKMMQKLTNHAFVVKDLLCATKDGSKFYYTATGENPTNTLIYLCDLQGNTELMTKEEGTHSFSLSTDGTYFMDAFSSLTVPFKSMLWTNNGKMAKLLMESKEKLVDYNVGTTEIGSIKGKDGSDLYYRMIKPSNFDPSKKYPVLVYVYGGPHAQMVTNSWLAGANLWMHWMANQGYIIYTLDNRGSGERGFAFESQIHRQLGTVEMEDQLSGVEFLKSLNYVDGNRLAVHGWSFGGFMTTSLMLRQAGVFKVGVAGGPVTDWKYYEIMYGERYMDRPEQNKAGYDANSLLNYTKNLKGDLLLIHGSIDDVVVMQHNEALLKSFIENGVQVDDFIYPMHKHNVTGKDRAHLMEKVLLYILDNNK
ncbi:MAG: S9 family peptidase [Crocinitomicaceae bacterium]|jgi:dipeptidyl-peptidase 4|nr:S9 family peptidase [Crocinitomicaceae bacterium]